jgi:hypothetical protein
LLQESSSRTGIDLDGIRAQPFFVSSPHSGSQQHDHANGNSHPKGKEQNALYGSFYVH